MSVETATVLGLLGSLAFLYWWQRDLSNSNVWSVGLKYMIRGATIGLLIPVTGYLVNINTTGALQSIVTVPHAVYTWVFWLVLVFLALNFTFDLLQPKRWGGK